MGNQGDNGGWEKVGGSNKNSGNSKKNSKFTKDEKKKFEQKAPKLEEIIPLNQLNSVYSGVLSLNQEKASSASPKVTKNNNANNKGQNSNKANNKKEKVEPEKKPESIQEAVKKVSVNELKSLLLSAKTSYPDNPLIWIRDAASYFNITCATLKPMSLSDPFSNFPVSLITKETRKTLFSMLEEAGVQGRHSGFETLLANLAHDLNKNLTGNGYIIMLQLMAEMYPTLVISNPERVGELMNSYQNRPVIGTSLLWALGQGGKKDLSVGLRVWVDFMTPVLTLRNYSKLVSDYLTTLLKIHAQKVEDCAKSEKIRVATTSQFFKMFDALLMNSATGSGNLSKDSMNQLLKAYQTFKRVSLKDCSLDHEIFAEALRRLSKLCQADAATKLPQYGNAKTELIQIAKTSLSNNAAAMVHWREMYITYIAPSALILDGIQSDKKPRGFVSCDSEEFKDTLIAFQEHNLTQSQSKDGVAMAAAASKNILTRMAQNCGHGSRGWFPWKTAIFALVVGLAFLVNQDIQQHGSLKASKTGLFLKDIGQYERTVAAYEHVLRSTKDGRVWAEKNLPIYLESAKKNAVVYGEKGRLMAVDGWNYVKVTAPKVVDKCNEYVPGAKEKLILAWDTSAKFASDGYAWLLRNGPIYVNDVKVVLVKAAGNTRSFCENIASGKVSAQDLKTMAEQRFNELGKAANSAFVWVSGQVKTLTG